MGMKILISDSLSKAGCGAVGKGWIHCGCEIQDAEGRVVQGDQGCRWADRAVRHQGDGRTDRGSREIESRRAGRVGPGQCRYAGSDASRDRRDEHAGRQYCDDGRAYDVDDLRDEPAYSPSHRVCEGRQVGKGQIHGRRTLQQGARHRRCRGKSAAISRSWRRESV